MSFSKEVKVELGKQTSAARHCQIAEFCAIFTVIGKIKSSRRGKHYIEIHTENLTVAQKSYMLLRKTFRADVEMMLRSNNLQGNVVNFYLIVRNQKQVLSILQAIKMIHQPGQAAVREGFEHQLLVQNTCCKRAFLRGTFLVAGSVTDPGKAYHLEISVLSDAFAKEIQRLIAFFGIDAKIVERKKYNVVYIKEGSQIVDFLNVVEAHVALMEFENVRIVKEVRNTVNRQVNCETANISKMVNAAAKQIEDIKYIECNMGFQKLTQGLRDIAELRLDYPDSSLQELGKMLNPPIGKSGVNHRLRKLGDIANQLREK